jgi:hypothetical protein
VGTSRRRMLTASLIRLHLKILQEERACTAPRGPFLLTSGCSGALPTLFQRLIDVGRCLCIAAKVRQQHVTTAGPMCC